MLAALFWAAPQMTASSVTNLVDETETRGTASLQLVQQRNSGPGSGGYHPPAYIPPPPVSRPPPPPSAYKAPPPVSRAPAYTQPFRPSPSPYATPSRQLPQIQRPFAQPRQQNWSRPGPRPPAPVLAQPRPTPFASPSGQRSGLFSQSRPVARPPALAAQTSASRQTQRIDPNRAASLQQPPPLARPLGIAQPAMQPTAVARPLQPAPAYRRAALLGGAGAGVGVAAYVAKPVVAAPLRKTSGAGCAVPTHAALDMIFDPPLLTAWRGFRMAATRSRLFFRMWRRMLYRNLPFARNTTKIVFE